VKEGFTNVAEVSGRPPTGPRVSATASAVVKAAPFTPPRAVVGRAGISIVKDPRVQSIANGGSAMFVITVTNSGEVGLRDVRVADELSSACDRSLGAMVAGDSVSYACSRLDVKEGFTNVAEVSGRPPTGPRVSATASAVVKAAPFRPPNVVAHLKPTTTG
jgi:hypothetical protein